MSSPTGPVKKTESPRPDAGHIPMTEELDSARWNLPPILPVAIAAAVLAIVIGGYLLGSKKAPTSSGSVNKVIALPVHTESKGSIAPGMSGTLDQDVEKNDQVLVTIGLDVKNAIQKPMYVKNLEAKLVTDKGEYTDAAAPASDFERIVQAYPELAVPGAKPFQSESSIPAGQEQNGLMVVSFRVPREEWDKRKSLEATINFYDHAPLVMDATKIAQAQESTLPTRVTK